MKTTLAPISSESDIHLLTSQVEQLTVKQSSWNKATVWFAAAGLTSPLILFFLILSPITFLIASSLAPTLAFIALLMTTQRSKELGVAHADLDQAKDEKLLRDLKEKELQIERVRASAELKIAEARSIAGQAHENAAKAAERTQEIEASNLKLAAQLAGLQKGVADAERERLEAQIALEQLKAEVERRKLSRVLRTDWNAFKVALKDKPTGEALILYQPENSEAADFGMWIYEMLKEAGWKAYIPIPIPPDLVCERIEGYPVEIQRVFTSYVRAGGNSQTELTILAKNLTSSPFTHESPYTVLFNAFSVIRLYAFGSERDANLSDNFFRIIIGEKL